MNTPRAIAPLVRAFQRLSWGDWTAFEQPPSCRSFTLRKFRPSRTPSPSASLLIVATTVLAGCDYPLGFGQAFVDGDWIYQAETPPGALSSCEISGLVLALDQEGDEFAGLAKGGELRCETATGTLFRSLDGAPVTNGEVRGRQVAFSIGAGLLEHRGLVEGRSMSGTFTSGAGLGEFGVNPVEGDFAAARPPRSSSPTE